MPIDKIDAAIARHVLSWRNEGDAWYAADSDKPVESPNFSADLALAWTIGERVCQKGFRLQIDGSKLWQARFYKSVAHTLETKSFSASAREPAMAICLAALAVMGMGPKP